jgi:SET domain-containing protein
VREVYALRCIQAHEEITVKYKCRPWFKVKP